MKIGFIGTGSMGSMLIETFLASGTLKEENIVITNRTTEKAYAIQDRYPNITVTKHIATCIAQSDWLFLCVKPKDMPGLFQKMAPLVRAEQLAISITSPISTAALDSALPCKTCRVIPTILNRAQAGATLMSFGERCTTSDKHDVYTFMSKISTPLVIEENITRVSSDIISCGPAFFSFLAQRLIEGACSQTHISEEKATALTTSMLIGLGKLLEEGHYTLPALQERVCVPGGITGEGIAALSQALGDGFDILFQRTHEKYEEEKKHLTERLTYQ
ncbi:late competence protein ComER [Shouchella lonarensis]|uniref:Competence protein ComER n=1 Tax=Shouchella lonarensis TaxID=1464122 RepID=A0A1G6KGQ6_9BACI|nr:late competence protein ComER [Shouchella lonarensis]SDC29991.1 competence protein ComER [Shouchella lonarensis]